MRKFLSAALLLGVSAICLGAPPKNFWDNPSFETWDEEGNRPTKSWRWTIQKMPGGNEFEYLGRSSKEKHSGEYSLLMKDTNPGPVNNVLQFHFSPHENKQLAGQVLTITAWVKQVRASGPRRVGIGLNAYTTDGKSHTAADWIDDTEETGWIHLRARLKVPENTKDLRATLYCANYFNNTAEAYFDDIVLTTDNVAKEAPQPLNKPAATVAAPAEYFLQLSPAPRTWRYNYAGFRPEKPVKTAEHVLVRTKGYNGAIAILEANTTLLNRRYDLRKVPQGKLGFQAELGVEVPLWVNLTSPNGKKSAIRILPKASAKAGRYIYEGQFTDHPEEIKNVSMHISMGDLKDVQQLPVYKMGLTAPAEAGVATFAPSPWTDKYVQEYAKPFSVTEDNRSRPIIRNGTWFQDGEYKFYLGPWIYNRNVDWGGNPARTNPLNIDHIAYKLPPGKEVFDAMGFNSAQISAAPSFPGQASYGLGINEDVPYLEKEFTKYVDGFQGMPLVVDFAFSYDNALAFQDPEKRREIDQRCGSWHAFNPACPEHPEGARFYHTLIDGGTKILMKNKVNVSVYELFNESVYGCQCSYNIRSFAKKMQEKYGTIEKANRTWNTIFENFDELAQSTGMQQYPGLWVEWWYFLANRYIEVLKHYEALVRETDKRPNIYFCEMLAVSQIWNSFMDYRAIGKAMDVLAFEGGWRYGHSSSHLRSTDGMADVVFSTGTHWYVCDFFAALGKGKKPIINNEHYCWRAEYGLRAPSKRTDMVTSLWMEIMHGSSGNFTYVLDKRHYDYRDHEGAKKNVIVPSYKSSSLLNPYNWPPEELDCFKIFNQEMEPYREKILPFPRTKAPSVAIYHSYPSHAMNQLVRDMQFRDRMQRWYSVLLHNYYPLTFVFDDDLEAGLPANIQALILPSVDYETDGVMENIRKFIARGGVVIAGKGAFGYDDHAVKRANPVIPGVHLVDSRNNGESGKLLEILAAGKVRRHGTLTPVDGMGALNGTDLQIIDRGDFKLVFMAGMMDIVQRQVMVRLNLEDQGEFYMTDIVNKRLYLSPTGEKWSAPQLRSGFKVILPSQERVVLVLERKRPEGLKPWSQLAVEQEYKDGLPNAQRILKEFNDRVDEAARVQREGRIYRDVNPQKCQPVDLRKHVNMHYRDEKGDDRKGGGFDQGAKDFANIRPGKVLAAGVPFDLIDSDRNNGKGLIILGGRDRNYFPLEVHGIPVNQKAKSLYFLHTMGWGGYEGELIMSYFVTYADGTKVQVPIRSNLEIGPWMNGREPYLPKNAKIGLESTNPEGIISFQNYRWNNPHPEKEIKSIDIRSTCGGGVPAIAAITLEKE